MRSDKPLSYACQRTGLNRSTLIALKGRDASLPIFKLSEQSHWRCDATELEQWIAAQKARRFDAFRSSTHGLGAHGIPPDLARKDAEADLRCIICKGDEPEFSQHWRNARLVRGDLPPDIAAAFDLAPDASFRLAVEKAETLINLPLDKRAFAMKEVAARLAAFHEDRAEV